MIQGINKSVDEQLESLEKILRKSKRLMDILKVLDEYSKGNESFRSYYVGAGSINQTIFNYYHGFDLNYGIKDFDIVYFDDSDLSYEMEDLIIKDLDVALSGIDAEYDIKNEARVHLWYPDKYGTNIEPYKSVEEAISSWGAAITCIGVRLENDKMKVFCPYGLNDIFGMTIRPVKDKFTKEFYDERAKRWKSKWKMLDIKEW